VFDENCFIILVLNFNTSGWLQSNSALELFTGKIFCAIFLEALSMCFQWHFHICVLFLVILLKQNIH